MIHSGKTILPIRATLLFIHFLLIICAMPHAGKFRLRLLKKEHLRPQLILITGSSGTGKSTFGMSLALNQGIDRCISTDTIREVLRTAKVPSSSLGPTKFSPSDPLFRSSYDGHGDPVADWRESCEVVQDSISNLIDDSIRRGVSLILEGVHLIPSPEYIHRWQTEGGVALGVVLNIKDPDMHREIIIHRGKMTGKGAEKKLQAFSRIRAISEEMLRLGELHRWMLVEQHIEYDPILRINDLLDEQLDDLLRGRD